MKAAIVVEAGRPPVFSEFRDPEPTSGSELLRVRAAAFSNLVKSRASGSHYSSSGDLPFVVGVDGVGTLQDGRRVYFLLPDSPFGSMSELTRAGTTHCVPVPDDLDDVTAAAIANPGMSSWVAFKERGKLVPGENVLINGATGTAGRLAVQVAKHLGARKVVATGRNPDILKRLPELGADVTIPLGDAGDGFEAALKPLFAEDGVDVVLDYLWGPSAERIIAAGARAGKDTVPIRFVHVGSLSGPTITLQSAALRSSAVSLMGSGIGSVPLVRIAQSIGDLLAAAHSAGFEISTSVYPLSDIEKVWSATSQSSRVVFQIPPTGSGG